MIVILIAIVSIGLLLQSDYRAKGATYGWFQNTWSGGADTEAVADHTHNQTGWLKFFSKDSQINTADDEIKLNLTTGSHTETDDASGFATGTHNNTYSTGTGIAMKKNNGVSCGGNIQCTSGNCDTDFSSGSYCHATATSCVYYSGGDPWELANGWEQCSGNDYYKSCNNSVWGAQQNSPDTANDYCDAGGGGQTGYDLAATCESKIDGGFTDPACESCSPYKANTTSTCKTSCASDTDCWSTHICSGGACLACGVGSVTYLGETYPTVQIGTQCWLAKNLNVGTMIPGNTNQANNAVIEKYCYDNLEANCTTYGGLYQWNEAMQYVTTAGTRGICPVGWHIPTDAEQYTLENYLKDDGQACNASRSAYECATAGAKLKQAGTTLWKSTNNATNSSGFTALPAGARYSNGTFQYISTHTHFWSSSDSGANALERDLFYSLSTIVRRGFEKVYGFSVRCIKE